MATEQSLKSRSLQSFSCAVFILPFHFLPDFLSRDCVPSHTSTTARHLYFDLKGAVIYSHPRYAHISDNISYPVDANQRMNLASNINPSSRFSSSPTDNFLGTKMNNVDSRADMESDAYPVNFTCEIYIRSVAKSRIMLRFQSFFIPSKRSICDENYLYVFDSNTPQFRAMVSKILSILSPKSFQYRVSFKSQYSPTDKCIFISERTNGR